MTNDCIEKRATCAASGREVVMSVLKLSELIAACQRALDKHGDLNVQVYVDTVGYEFNTCVVGWANGYLNVKVSPDDVKAFAIGADA